MADITINIPTDKVARVVHALCQNAVDEEGAPVEDAATAKAAVVAWIKHRVWQVETQEAEAAAAVDRDDEIVS